MLLSVFRLDQAVKGRLLKLWWKTNDFLIFLEVGETGVLWLLELKCTYKRLKMTKPVTDEIGEVIYLGSEQV